jgi:hypothetical protein
LALIKGFITTKNRVGFKRVEKAANCDGGARVLIFFWDYFDVKKRNWLWPMGPGVGVGGT